MAFLLNKKYKKLNYFCLLVAVAALHVDSLVLPERVNVQVILQESLGLLTHINLKTIDKLINCCLCNQEMDLLPLGTCTFRQ